MLSQRQAWQQAFTQSANLPTRRVYFALQLHKVQYARESVESGAQGSWSHCDHNQEAERK